MAITPELFAVICTDDGARVLATRQLFPSRAAAAGYAATIAASRAPLVVGGHWLELRPPTEAPPIDAFAPLAEYHATASRERLAAAARSEIAACDDAERPQTCPACGNLMRPVMLSAIDAIRRRRADDHRAAPLWVCTTGGCSAFAVHRSAEDIARDGAALALRTSGPGDATHTAALAALAALQPTCIGCRHHYDPNVAALLDAAPGFCSLLCTDGTLCPCDLCQQRRAAMDGEGRDWDRLVTKGRADEWRKLRAAAAPHEADD